MISVHQTALKWYSGLKNYFEVDSYNAALRLYTCTHIVYSLFNDIYNSECVLAAVLLPSDLPSELPWTRGRHGPVNFRVRRIKVGHRKLAINWQLGNFGQNQLEGLLIWKWWIEWCLIVFFLYLTQLEAWIKGVPYRHFPLIVISALKYVLESLTVFLNLSLTVI